MMWSIFSCFTELQHPKNATIQYVRRYIYTERVGLWYNTYWLYVIDEFIIDYVLCVMDEFFILIMCYVYQISYIFKFFYYFFK
jgi:hypothetical protein